MSSATAERRPAAWAERAAALSPAAQQAHARRVQRAEQVVQAAHRLLATKGANFTTQELVREAHISFRSFYQHFLSKDEVVLAVVEDVLQRAAGELAVAARDLSDPLDRLHFYVTDTVHAVVGVTAQSQSRFITSEYWRLHQLYPQQLEQARQPFVDLLIEEVRAAKDAGLLRPRHIEGDAWLVANLVAAMYHHFAYAEASASIEGQAERIWEFCLAALGGSVDEDAARRGRTGSS